MKAIIKLDQKRGAASEYPVPCVTLRVQDRYGAWTEVLFRIDSGASVSALPIWLAQHHGMGFQQQTSGQVRGLVGVTSRFRDRLLRVRIGGREHHWPCDFVDVPPQAQQGATATPYGVLGRAGFLDEYAVAIDSGFLIITRLGPMRRLLRRCLHGLWSASGRIRAADEAL
jgi:hypothetical protein